MKLRCRLGFHRWIGVQFVFAYRVECESCGKLLNPKVWNR